MGESLPDPVDLLAAHLERTKRNASRFAEDADVDATVITRALARERRPGLDSAIKIERGSNGDVPVQSWEHFRAAPRKGEKRRRTA